ncbi:nucleoside/nucleotide kinase family protein [Galactobacter caseinivorans]|uniref:Uncharacterized protein n=1 Tax=Galactobacter caseinivorans TaxID=2676123 RepID=A0A496PIC5_9MICC|nr:hypothetical protein [Galactobacter caseinivorans]RKW70253.1 hypothetical protein DWQ67_09985 [Galactobacter caseinivorans]
MTRPLLLAIDGRSGAGKTTLAQRLLEDLTAQGHEATLFHLEDLYPGWHGLRAGIDAYVGTVLAPLSQGKTAHWTPWDWTTDAPAAQTRQTPATDVVLLEGVGAADPAALPYLSASLRLRASPEQRRRLALTRDGASYEPWWDIWAAQEAALTVPDDAPCDLSLQVTDPADPALRAAAVAWAQRALAKRATEAQR